MGDREGEAGIDPPAVGSTVQAPHWPWSHPFFVPVRPSRSRSRSSSDIRLSTVTARGSPLTVTVIRVAYASFITRPTYPGHRRLLLGDLVSGDGRAPAA